MDKSKPSVKLSFDKLRSGQVSIKLRLYWNGQKKRFHLPLKDGVTVSSDDYEKLVSYHQLRNKRRVSEDIRQLYDSISVFIERAEALCEEISRFSFDEFGRLFYTNIEAGTVSLTTDLNLPTTVLGVLAHLENQMNEQKRPGNADAFQSAGSSLKRFLNQLTAQEIRTYMGAAKDPLLFRFDQMTSQFLYAYEDWMTKFGKLSQKKDAPPTGSSLTTVGIYTRSLRTAFNYAISKGLATGEQYPFGKNGYGVPAGRNPKKALKKSVIDQLRAHKLEPGSMQERSRDLWLLSYFSNGLNFADICQLRWSNINYVDSTITVIRKKTERTQRGNHIKIVAQLFEESRQIIDRWASPLRDPSDYVFPFLNHQMTDRQLRDGRRLIIKTTNKWIKRIGQQLGIEADLSTYAARHSFGTHVLRAGADLNQIKAWFGHSTLKTTENYLSSFDNEEATSLLRRAVM